MIASAVGMPAGGLGPRQVCTCQAMLVSVISLGHHLLSGWDQFRVRARAARTAGIDTLDAQPSRRAALLAKIADTKKTCIAHALAVLVAIFEARCIVNRSPCRNSPAITPRLERFP